VGEVVVVPARAGPLVPVAVAAARRDPDELDALIDDLLPDVADGPGATDVVLVVAGVGAAGVAAAVGGPGWVVGAGAGLAALGCVLPARALWRRAADRRRARAQASILARGTALDVSAPATARLAAAYGDLLVAAQAADADVAGAAIAAAHGAVLEVATLSGETPPSAGEVAYVEQRTDAVRALAAELRADAAPAPADVPGAAPRAATDRRAALVEARDELDRLSGASTVDHLHDLADEARMRRDRG
jgi:hypothetical protein